MSSPRRHSSENNATQSVVRFSPDAVHRNSSSDDRQRNINSSDGQEKTNTTRSNKFEKSNHSADRNDFRRGIKHSIPYLSTVENYNGQLLSRFTISASNKYRYCWDVWIFILFMYVALVSVFVFSFLNSFPRNSVWFVIERILDAFFIIDIVLNFFTFYKVKQFEETPVTLKHTIQSYLSRYFLTDLIATIPWDIISYRPNTPVNILLFLRYIRLLRLVKLPRIYRALRLRESFTQFEVKFHIKYGHMRLVSLVFSVILIAHWFACLFYFFGTIPDSTNASLFTSWTGVEDKVPTHTYGRYILSLYFSIYTITTIGYGDVVPGTTFERTYVNVIMFLGAACFTYVISQVSNINVELHENSALRRRMMDMLTDLTRIQKIPPSLAVEIRQYFHDYFTHRRVTDEKALLDLMSNGLRQRVWRHMYGEYVNKTGILKTIPDHKLNNIYRNIFDTFKHKDDVLFNDGDLADGLYIVKSGLVTLTDDVGDHVNVGDGGVIGVADMPIRRNWKFKAVVSVNSEVLQISRSCVLEALESCPGILSALRHTEASKSWQQGLQVLQRHMRLVTLSQQFREKTKEWLRQSGHFAEEIDEMDESTQGCNTTAGASTSGNAETSKTASLSDAGAHIEGSGSRAMRNRRNADGEEDDVTDVEKLQKELREKRERVDHLEEQIAKLRHHMKEFLSNLGPRSGSL